MEPSPPDPPTASSTPAASPKRPWTILGRLSKAIREQNWFAVALELVIVVLGVVIGFQVTAWGQARSDRAKEQTYLRQLVVDLTETERVVADTEASRAPSDRAAGQLSRAYRSLERPPRDSLMQWLIDSLSRRAALPVMGTVEALIATGDLALIRDDSLRSGITAYAQKMGVSVQSQYQYLERERDAVKSITDRVDIDEIRNAVFSPAETDSLARAQPNRGIQIGEQRRPFPVTVEEILSDREIYNAVHYLTSTKRSSLGFRQQMLAETLALRQLVEAELNQ